MSTLQKIQDSYQKLKRSLYYEKLDLINRQEIVEFESSLDNNLEKLEKKLNNIASWLDESKVNEISNEILEQIDSIGISIYPKKVVPFGF